MGTWHRVIRALIWALQVGSLQPDSDLRLLITNPLRVTMAWQWGREGSLQTNLQLFMQICLHTDNQSHRWGTQGRGEIFTNDGSLNFTKIDEFGLDWTELWTFCCLQCDNWNLNSAVEFKLTFPGSLLINWVILTVSNMVYFAVINVWVTHQCHYYVTQW